jgi:hypothetical protein
MRPEDHSADERTDTIFPHASAVEVDMYPSGRNAITAAPCLKSRYLDSEVLGFQGTWISKHLDFKMRIRRRHSMSEMPSPREARARRAFRAIRVMATSARRRAHRVQLSRAYSTQSCMLKEGYTLFHRQKNSTQQKSGTFVYPSSVDFRSDADEE